MSLYFHGTRSPISRSPILWSLLFMGVNGVNLARLLMEETPVQFCEEELDVFEVEGSGSGFRAPAAWKYTTQDATHHQPSSGIAGGGGGM